MTTRDEIMTMDEDALRLTVAKACGYRMYAWKDEAYLTLPSRTGILPKGYNEVDALPAGNTAFFTRAPDYPRDLTAAYALEDALPVELRGEYSNNLRRVILQMNNEYCTQFDLIHATAADRCRAWLLTMDAKPYPVPN